MNTAPLTQPDPCKEREREALLRLLADDDPEVFTAVRNRIISFGPEVCTWLRPHILSSDPHLRRHSQEIIDYFERREADREFLLFCLGKGENLDLETGALLLARTTYPSINTNAYRALLDFIAESILPQVQPGLKVRELLGIINRHLFNDLGFRGDQTTYFDPRNSYLNQVLDRRTGNPISLCLIYLLVTRRLQLPVAGIGLPGHFICRFQSSLDSVYIDAFDRGRLLTKADCIQFLLHSAIGLHEQFLAPVSARRMLLRMCGNLYQSYTHLELKSEALRIKGYLAALSPANSI
jgi:regulator of sirC expression with transglutaminase-like and TPR domain